MLKQMRMPWILDNLAIESVLYSLSHLLAPFAFNFLNPKQSHLHFTLVLLATWITSRSTLRMMWKITSPIITHYFVKRLTNEEADSAGNNHLD